MENNLKFIGEQDGDVERKFKQALSKLFLASQKPLRAYLVRAQWETNGTSQVMLCMRIPGEEDFDLLNKSADVFRSMFAETQNLDMMFITEKQEKELRTICCPFYTSAGFNVKTPDFYLFSHEGYRLDDEPRACFMRKRLFSKKQPDPEGFMLCDISPPLIGQPYGRGGNDIHQLVFASRLQGQSLFPVSIWPISIYVLLILNESSLIQGDIDKSDYELIAWASLYRKAEEIDRW